MILCEVMLQVLTVIPLQEISPKVNHEVHCGFELAILCLLAVGFADI